jgi:NDP-sugar pyrophosphorylase family protein
MQKHVFDFISDGTFSLEREVFPRLCRGLIFGYQFPGYWFDCGSLVPYLKAQSAIINAEGLGIEKKAKLEGCMIERPVAIEKGARLRGTRIGPNVYVEEDCATGEGTVLDNCTIMKGAKVGKGCVISGSIIGPGCALPDAAGSHNQILVRASE